MINNIKNFKKKVSYIIAIDNKKKKCKVYFLKGARVKILILGADGYLGWPSAMHFSSKGNEVCAVDNFSKRKLELELGTEPLNKVPTLHERVSSWNKKSKKKIELKIGDLVNPRFIYKVLSEFKPDAIIHYAEQPSAPYSMIGREQAVFTQYNNVIGNLNLLFAMKSIVPNAHLVKLGTMGEYGTPNIDIEEGYIRIKHNGREDTLPFPKKPGSFYHLSKVHDSHNILLACDIWKLRATDLNQGVVYGIETSLSNFKNNQHTSFHYDQIFGTVLNRFCVQSVLNIPLSVYGDGDQIRGYLNIIDTIKCVEIAIKNPSKKGEFRVFNQFTETFSVNEIAKLVQRSAKRIGLNVNIKKIKNPRIEMPKHYYNPKNTNLLNLGLKPVLLDEGIVVKILKVVEKFKDNIVKASIMPTIKWNNKNKIS